MSTKTTNYEFIMPELTDSPPDITATNPNWEKMDAELKAHDDVITESANLISTKLSRFIGATVGTATALTVIINGATLDDFTNIQIRLHVDIGNNPTLNLNGLGAKPIYTPLGEQVKAGTKKNAMMNLSYNATENRWYLLDAYGGSAIAVTIKNVWQTWVSLGGLIPSDYTDINAVVSNATAMACLANSSLALGYMIESTGIIMTAAVGSVNAMTRLGLSSAAMNAIIGNATWASAVLASTNAIAGLDASSPISVPTMTSNTTPAGVCSGISREGPAYDYYMSFDKNDTSWWGGNVGGVTNKWIQYTFATAIFVYKATLKWTNTSNYYPFIKTFKVLYSDDGITFIEASTVLTTTQTNITQTFQFDIPYIGRHKYWRVMGLTNHGSSTDIGVCELNFFGK